MSGSRRGQDTPSLAADGVSIGSEGVVHVLAQDVPVSPLLSPEAKVYATDHLRYIQDPKIQAQVNGLPRHMKPYLNRQRALYPVKREDTRVVGVHAYVYTPESGIAPQNRNRAPMSLHGGGFMIAGPDAPSWNLSRSWGWRGSK